MAYKIVKEIDFVKTNEECALKEKAEKKNLYRK